MKTRYILLFVAVFGLITGCSPSREKKVSRIRDLEKRLFAPESVSFDKVKADSLMALYDDFIKNSPKDSLAPGFLFKEANVAMNMNDGNRAVALFDQYIQDYPEQKKAPVCMFFKAFVYENISHDLDKAREAYLQFIEKYPSNDFVKDAKMALQNLGKTPEMLVKEFEMKRKADSTKVADSLSKTKKSKPRH
ncbi:MAG: tetratricopeptide repeat protein [Bacteroidota bacterium]